MHSKFISLCLVIGISILVVACNSKSDKKDTPDTTAKVPTDNTTVKNPDTTAANKMSARVYCNVMAQDPQGNPHSEIWMEIDGKQTKLSAANACDEIPKSDWKTYEIPENAINAVGGFWAGLGTYFYLIQKDGKYVVMEGHMDEGVKGKGYNWREWKGE